MNPFRLDRSQIGAHQVLGLTHEASQTSFSIIPSYGAALNRFSVKGKAICVEAQSEADIEAYIKKSYGGAQLFPWPNRIKEGGYTYAGKSYTLPANDVIPLNALHGLIYHQRFEVASIDEAAGKIQLFFEYKAAHPGYPFHARIENTFQLAPNTLTVETKIINQDTQAIPVAHGWHPYFQIEGGINDALLQISSDTLYTIEEKHLICTGETESFDKFSEATPIGDDYYNLCFALQHEEIATLSPPDQNYLLKLSGEGYPYLQIYTPSDRQSIALEPQTSIADVFNNGIGLKELAPGEKLHLKFRMEIE